MYKFVNPHVTKEQTYYKIHAIFLKTCHDVYIHSILIFFSKKYSNNFRNFSHIDSI